MLQYRDKDGQKVEIIRIQNWNIETGWTFATRSDGWSTAIHLNEIECSEGAGALLHLVNQAQLVWEAACSEVWEQNLQPHYKDSDWPIAEVIRVDGSDWRWWKVLSCPYCGSRHKHGLEVHLSSNYRDNGLGLRAAHCSQSKKLYYRLVEKEKSDE